MQPLRVTVGDKTVVISEQRVVRIGRANDADIVLSGETVSRVHAELRPTDIGWILVDVGSQHGTYVDGQRITELRIERPVRAYCGIQGSGATLDFDITRERPVPAAAPETNRVGAPAQGGQADRPGPAPAPAQLDPAFAETVSAASLRGSSGGPTGYRTGPDLVVEAGGAEQRFQHPAQLTIGRHPDCSVVVSDPMSSRYHGRIDAVPGGWTYSNASKEGTYVDGRRVEVLKLQDRAELRLGHPVAGAKVTVTPLIDAQTAVKRIARRRMTKRATAISAIAVALLLVAGVLGVALTRDNGSGGPSTAADALTATELNTAKVATVLIYAQSTTVDGKAVAWSGSGSMISAGGMILTNAHVATPQADGLAEKYGPADELNPKFLQIALIKSPDDTPADPEYRARVVVTDGHIDAAVIQIYATIDGGALPAGSLNLPTVPIGDSDTLRTGDDVTVLGFPGISQSAAVSVTRGVISTFIDDPDLGPRSEIDTDARIAPGNSGGMAIDDSGKLIGIPSAYFTERGTPITSGRIRPINVVKPLIEQAQSQTQ
jgi:putative serine protease PepD